MDARLPVAVPLVTMGLLAVPLVTMGLHVVPLVGSGTVGSVPNSVEPAGPADAGLHGNHVAVGTQVSADGTVIAGEAATLAPGFLVLRNDDGDRPGEPLGHTALTGATIRTDVSVAVDDDVWADWSGTRTLWAVVHLDDGDGEFDPAADPSAADRYPSASRQFRLERGDAPVRILARQTDAVALRNGTLTVRRVDLAADGYVVAHPLDDDHAVGARALPAGSHRNVSLDLDESFVADRDRRFRVHLVAYRGDGDAEFDDDDRPVSVGGGRVETVVVVRRVEGGRTTEPLVVTPSPKPGTSGADSTPAGSAGPATVAGEETSGAGPTAPTGGTNTDADADGVGRGFGVAVAVGAILAVAVVFSRRSE